MSRTNVHAGMGAGKFRDPWVIKRFLSEQGTNMAREAEKIGVWKQVFAETVKGSRNHRKVLRHLRDMGCPRKGLSLPEDLQEPKACASN